VLTLSIENHVAAERVGEALEAARLAACAATLPAAGQPWPTLRELVTSGRRLCIVVEQGDGGTAYLWLANAFDHLMQETPYTADTLAALGTSTENRDRPDAPCC
jgi:hypothetical protein